MSSKRQSSLWRDMDDLDSGGDESFLKSHLALIVFAVAIAAVIAYLILTNIQPIVNALNPGG